jgi:septum formation protein
MNSLNDKLNNFPYKIILASASPRRQELLRSLGFNFTVKKIDADESQWPGHLKKEEIPLFLAELKARAYQETILENEIIITADTVVWCNDKVYNKPENFEEGKDMLRELSGKAHEVFTAVFLKGASKNHLFMDRSLVFFKEFSDAEIEYYLETCKPYDKAGAYGVQEWLGYIGIEKIEGSFYNVMGLPVKQLYEALMSF